MAIVAGGDVTRVARERGLPQVEDFLSSAAGFPLPFFRWVRWGDGAPGGRGRSVPWT